MAHALHPVVRRVPPLERAGLRALTVLRRPLERDWDDAAASEMYGASYFGVGRKARTRGGRSGYNVYSREASHANLQAYLLWRFFAPERALDVGTALGYTVEALVELGIDAAGTDVSEYAVEHATPRARGRVRQATLGAGPLPFPDASFDLVSAFEVLEHLPPERVDGALAALRRVCRGWCVLTIPSIGPNDAGPPGCLPGKVADDRIPRYEDLGPDYDGPVPYEDLLRDFRGLPVQGHLTVASFRWWTRRFEAAGFERARDVERRMHPVVGRFNMSVFWNLYVFRVPGTPDPGELRSRAELALVERMWHLDEIEYDGHTANVVLRGLGGEGLHAVAMELEASRAAGTPRHSWVTDLDTPRRGP
jgi:SAM-dependent methyltransferase